MFTFIVIAVGVIVIWRILAAARRQSAFEARFGPSHMPPTQSHDPGFSHLYQPHDPPFCIAGGVGSTTGDASHGSAGGAGDGGSYDAPSSGGFDSSSASDSSSSSGGFDSGSSGGGDYGGGGSGGSWS